MKNRLLFAALALLPVLVFPINSSQAQLSNSAPAETVSTNTRPTAAQDHQQMMDQLHITSIRPGRNGNNPESPNYANYDEAKANPFPTLPDALTLKNGKKVTS